MYKHTCETCVFHTNNRQHYSRHILSKRHISQNDNKYMFTHVCDICSRKFKGQSGLYQHKMKCVVKHQKNKSHLTPEQSQEILESVNELKIMISDIKTSHKPASTNVINNQNNINIILNEKFNCAKNFIDMVNGIQLLPVYPPTITSEDYVNTIVGMLKEAIDQYPITERPIQCIKDEDENQKILHIRHQNEWHKEKEIDWTTQIHNSSLGEDDAPTESEEKIIFHAIKNMEKHLLNKIGILYGREAQRDYSYEVGHPSNKIRIIKYILEYINIEREELMKIIEETYNIK